MKYYLTRLIIFVLALSAQVCFSETKFLNSKEIRTLISGRDMIFYGSYGPIKFEGAAKWSNNGTIRGYTKYLSKKKHWQGRWYISNNQYCRTLYGDGKKDSRCHRVKQINKNTIQFIKSNGKIMSTTVLK